MSVIGDPGDIIGEIEKVKAALTSLQGQTITVDISPEGFEEYQRRMGE